MTLEDKLIDNLINTYKMKGKNVQGILQNPLFQGLSLSDKIRMINKYAIDLASTPHTDYKSIVPAAVAGAGLALSGSAGRMLMMGGNLNNLNFKLALGVGAAIGAGAKYVQNNRQVRQDREIADSIGNPYTTIVLNSMRKDVPAPNVTKLHDIANVLGSSKLDADKPK